MTKTEETKFTVIKQLEEGKITRKEASATLNLSLRQIDRLRKNYRIMGKDAFIHKNKGRKSSNKKDSSAIEELKQLYLTEYYDFNFIAFFEVINENDEYKSKYAVSYSTLYRAFVEDDIISPYAHKGTTKLYIENMENAISNNEPIEEEKKELFNSRRLEFERAHTRKSNSMYGFGQEVQMDAAEAVWFGDVVSHLHLAVDRGTKKVLAGWFEYEELTRGYFVLLYNMIVNYGIPMKIKTDNRNCFSNQEGKVNTTQVGIICDIFNISIDTSSNPTSKPNVERENGTFERRLIAELRHAGITEIDEANRYLCEMFIPKMNQKFSYAIDPKTSKMRQNIYSEFELNLIISEKFIRIIDNASSIRFDNKYYMPVDPETGEVVSFLKKTKCTVLYTYNAEYWCQIEEHYYQLVEVESRDITMVKESEKVDDKPVEKQKYIPPKDHPWRKNMMLR